MAGKKRRSCYRKPTCKHQFYWASTWHENWSLDKHNMRYKWMVCDGDSKSHSSVKNVYGEACTVEKLDCVGHVQKRMGKHLLKLKASFKEN
jgi:hypothetical protein